MRAAPPLRLALVAACIVVALAVALAVRHVARAAQPVDYGQTVHVTDAQRAAGFSFSASVSPADRAWIEQAVATARPEARRLIGEVDGLVTIEAQAELPQGEMGWTQPTPDGYRVGLNIAQLDGERTIDRDVVVLHELGHVVDFSLLPPAVDARLDAGIPRGTSCGDGGPWGACAPTPERIADTFAKWALGGAVSQVGAGYGIPNPASLEDWGAPLDALAAGLPAG